MLPLAVPLGTYSVSGAAVVMSDDYTADISTAGLAAHAVLWKIGIIRGS